MPAAQTTTRRFFDEIEGTWYPLCTYVLYESKQFSRQVPL